MFSWSTSTQLKIVGADGHSPDSLRGEVARGAKFVIYSYNFSLLVVSFKQPSSIYFILPGENRVLKGLPFTLISLVFGWWGIPWGLIYTIQSLVQNLGGGKDVTEPVLASIAPPPVSVDATAAGTPPPVAAPVPFNPRPYLLAGGVLAGVVALVYVGTCYQRGQHLPVALVSGLAQPYQVTLNGERHTVRPGRPEVVELPEGAFTLEADFPGGLHEKQQFAFTTEFLARPFSDRIAVLNPDGAAVVYEETTTYQRTNDTSKPVEPTFVLHAAETSYFLDKPEILFAAFPEKISMPSSSSGVTKTRLHVLDRTGPLPTANFIGEKLGHPAAIRYLTTLARINPNDEFVLRAAVQTLKPDEGLKFFEPRLAQRPVLLEWHRFYQQFTEYFAPQLDLRAKYRAALATEPANGDLLYLLARLETDRAVSRPLYERALTTQPPCTYAYGALGFEEVTLGHFDRALEFFAQAESHGLHSESVLRNKRAALLGLRQFEPVLQEASRRRQASPNDLELVADEIRLTLAASRGTAAAATLKAACLARYKAQKVATAEYDSADHYLAAIIACSESRLPEYARQLALLPNHAENYELALARGDLPAAEKILAAVPRVNSQAWLLLYLAEVRAGDTAAADRCFAHAVTEFATESVTHKQLAASLAGGPSLTPEAICELSMFPDEKRVILAALGVRQPTHRDLYFRNARLMNLEPGFPQLFLASILSP